jgi:photosystem II stability/assembly factor-like uncharacterized protein
MTDDFDRRLQRRLALLADEVPIRQFERGLPAQPRRPARVVSRGLAVGGLAVLAVVLMVEVSLGFPSGSAGPPQPAGTTATGSPNARSSALTPSPGPVAAGSPSPALSPAVTPSVAPAHSLAAGRLGFNGLMVWNQTDSVISVSHDAGRTWSDVGLPQVAPASILAVSGAPGRAMWVAAKDGTGVRLFRRPDAGGDWASALLTPSWPTIFGVNGQPIESALLTPGPAGVVTVAETIGVGTSVADTSLFVSTDDGVSFTQHQPKANSLALLYWESFTLVTPQSGVLVEGSHVPIALIHTPDAGTTWTKALISGLPAVDFNYFGTPAVNGADIAVPLTSWAAADNTNVNFAILTSHDGGVTFKVGTPLPIDTIQPPSDTLGQVTWVLDETTNTLHQSQDGGLSWSSLTTTLPAGVSRIHLTGTASAIASLGGSNCTPLRAGCSQGAYLMSTTDGGRTWSNL